MTDVLGPLDSGPNWGVMTDRDVLERARDLPAGYGEMFRSTVAESFITSPGIGTAIRGAAIPEAVPERMDAPLEDSMLRDPLAPPRAEVDAPPRFTPPQGGRLVESEEEYQIRRKRAGALSKEEWEASPYFRTGIPYDTGMTQDRASALAAWYDASKVRQDTIARGPGGFLGNAVWVGGMFVGGSADPINYIPILGPEVRAAQIAKFGRLGGSALTSAADAMLSTAGSSAATAGIRANFGDEVTWQGFLTDVAISTVIGGAFGAATSRWQGWQTSRSAHELERVVEARRALNDALHDVVQDRPVEVTHAVADAVDRAAQRVEPERVRIARENPAEIIAERIRRADPELSARDADLARQERLNRETIDDLTAELGDDETFGPLRRAMIELEQARAERAAKLQKLERALERTDSKKQKAKLSEQIDALKSETEPQFPEGIDPALIDRLQFLEESRALRQQALERVIAQRSDVTPRMDELRARVTGEYWDEVRRAEPSATAAGQQMGIAPASERMAVAAPQPEAPDPAAIAASAKVGQPAKNASDEFGIALKTTKIAEPAPEPPAKKTVKAIRGEDGRISGLEVEGPSQAADLAKQQGISIKTGDFPEMAEFEQLVTLGRVTPEELAAVKQATELEIQSDAYAKALEAAAICRVGM